MRMRVYRFLLVLFVCSFIASTHSIVPIKSTPGLIVDPDDYATIQEAIDNATEGDTIFVRASTYFESLTIGKSLSLVGEARESTIINGNGAFEVIKIRADNISIIGFTIENGKADAINVADCENISIAGNTIRDSYHGIWISNSHNSTIVHNVVDVGHYGIVCGNFNHSVISNNTIKKAFEGIHLENSENNKIIHNNVANCTAIGIYTSGNEGIVVVSWNNVSDSYHGIIVKNAKHSTVTHNVVKSNGHWGILVNHLNNSVVSYNEVMDNFYGISLLRANNNTITNNDALGNYFGIGLESYSNNNLVDENIFSNGQRGIMMISSSSNNTITRNTVADNQDYGVFIGSSNNLFYHNNFMDNDNQVYMISEVNLWDNGCEGNYWSDYNGTDSDGDGIGDTPYVVDENNQDNYPLMNLYWNPADVNHDLKVDIFDVVLACSAYSSTPLDPNWNCHCDIAEPYGVIDIFDIVMIAGSYGEEYLP